jgi:hypothetical protein
MFTLTSFSPVSGRLALCSALALLSVPLDGICGPINDDVENALALVLGVPASFNSAAATVQANEVTPGPGSFQSCRAQDGWCGSTVNPRNTLWFSFQAPSDPVAIFVDQGWLANLQLAVWQADDINDFASFTELAANDDANSIYAPGILPMTGLTAGAEYLIQVSGNPGYEANPATSSLKASALNRLDLATGHLGAGTMGLFEFTLSDAVGAMDYFTISTAGSSFNTEIALYDSQGRLVAQNDNIASYNLQSQLRFGFGGDNGSSLSAGDYTLVLGGFNSIFRDGDIQTSFPHSGDFQIAIESTQPVLAPAAPSYQAVDGNYLPASIHEIEIARGNLGSGEIHFFPISLAQDIGGADWATIHTTGSLIDTEIALFNAAGNMVAENNNISSTNLFSRLSFGFDADDGSSLLAGEYSLALGAFNTIFRDLLDVTSTSNMTGEYAIYLQIPTHHLAIAAVEEAKHIPEPTHWYLLLSGGLALLLVRCRGVGGRGLMGSASQDCVLLLCR